MMPKDRVLFVCTDGARSLVAAAILAKYGSGRFEPCCAATHPGSLDSRVRWVLQEPGVEWDNPWLQPLANMRGAFRDIMVLDQSVSVPGSLTGKVRDWDVPNPVDVGTTEAFAEGRDLIEGMLFDWLTQFEESQSTDKDAARSGHHFGLSESNAVRHTPSSHDQRSNDA